MNLSTRFLDESIAKFYTAEKNISRLLNWATGLAIFISCLGLLGLVMFITNQRTKEIGIRKVIGATVTQIVTLLSKDFLKLVLIGFLIAIPIAWWGTNMWLENFAFKTTTELVDLPAEWCSDDHYCIDHTRHSNHQICNGKSG